MTSADEQRKRGHETRDANVRAVALVVAGILVVIVVVHVLMYFLFIGTGAPLPGPIGLYEPPPPPARAPALSISPPVEAERLLRRERHLLETYDWVDRGAGLVRIPIERAMEMLVERGVPVRGAEGTPEVEEGEGEEER